MSTDALMNVYLDYAAATPLDAKVYAAMRPWLMKKFANPSALYAAAVEARTAVEEARKKAAEVLFTQPTAIIFTSGGTESINLALQGVTDSHKSKVISHKSPNIVTTKIEHHAVLAPIRRLEKDGWKVTYLSVDRQGRIDLDDFKKALRKETVLVSIQYANNEIGAIQPLADIGREILKWRKARRTPYPYFHTDACQAAAYLDLNVEKLHIDLMSLNGSKIYGPKGVGVLYKRRGVRIEPLMSGGGQEFGLRSGTENVAGIVGMAAAMAKVKSHKSKVISQTADLRNYFWKKLQKNVNEIILNGPALTTYSLPIAKINRLPNNLNVSFAHVDAEALIIYLSVQGIDCSSQSACSTDSDEVSHVLLACGLSEAEAQSSVRFTLGRATTKKELDYVLDYLPEIVKKMRLMNQMA